MSHKLTEQQKQQIIYLKTEGYSSREIAKMCNVGKSTVNDLYNLWLNASLSTGPKAKAKVLFLDIETAPDVSVSFGRYNQNISQDAVLQDGGWLLSIAWAWGDGEVQGKTLPETFAEFAEDEILVYKVWELIEQADIVVMQNGDKFDLPVIKARCVVHDLPPLKKVKTVDTLKIAKSMKFPSNKLDSLGHMLGVGRKQGHSGISLWVSCLKGDGKALNEMLEYNKQDVELLRDVYHKLKAWDSKAPNMGLYEESDNVVCRVCGSHDVSPTANQVHAGASLYSEVICNDCGARSRFRTANTTKSKRQALLA